MNLFKKSSIIACCSGLLFGTLSSFNVTNVSAVNINPSTLEQAVEE